MKLFRAFAMLALVAGIPAAIAQDAPQAAPEKPAEEKKICRAVTPTGSVMSKRVCLTAAEWKKLNAAYDRQSATLREGQSRTTANPVQ